MRGIDLLFGLWWGMRLSVALVRCIRGDCCLCWGGLKRGISCYDTGFCLHNFGFCKRNS